VKPSLRGYAAAVLEDSLAAGRLEQVADEMAQVVDFVNRTTNLFSALTDVAVPDDARRDVLRDLLQERVTSETLRMVLRATNDERAPEFPVALGELSELARKFAIESASGQVPDTLVEGAVVGRQFGVGYATAVLESVGTIADLEEIEDQLFRFARIVEASPPLRNALADPNRSITERRDLVSGLLGGKVLPATVRLARGALHARVRDPVKALDSMVDEAARARGWRVARVRSAREIDEREREQLSSAIERVTGTRVELQVTDDPDLLGGAVVEVGDLLVDASAKHRLDQLEEHLLGPEGDRRGASQTWQS